MLNKGQIKLVQIAVRQAGLRSGGQDGRYRMLLSQYKQPNGSPVTSCKQLNNWQMDDILAICESLGWYHPEKATDHYRALAAKRDSIASFAQKEAMERIREQLRQVPRDERIAKYAGELRTYSAYVDWDATSQLKDIKPPVFVLYGTDDSVFPAAGSQAMAQLIPNVQVKAFENADHGVTRFPEALDLIQSFLQRNTPDNT